MLDLHAGKGDYLIAFDFHDDVVMLDSANAPTVANFFQVKSKEKGNWSIADICRLTGKASKQSILGKLYDHRVRFAVGVGKLTLVSNARFNIPTTSEPSSTDRQELTLSDLSSDAIAQIRKKLLKELELTGTELESESECVLHCTALPLVGFEKYAMGHLAVALDKMGRANVPAAPTYRTLYAEICSRNNQGFLPASFSDLNKLKGISRNELNEFLQMAHAGMEAQDYVAIVSPTLLSQGMPSHTVSQIVKESRRYWVDRLDRTNLVVSRARDVAAQLIDDFRQQNKEQLNELLHIVNATNNATLTEARQVYGSNYVMAIAAVEYYDAK